MTAKQIVGKIHLWLGLASGLVVVIVALTGCIYAFQVEIQELTQSYRFVKEQEQSFLPPSALKSVAEKQLPGKSIHSVQYAERNRAAQLVFFGQNPEYYYVVYLNPYNGEVLKVKNMEWDFFRLVLVGHYYLWLPEAVGKPVVASSSLIFLAMLISGIILWWPKNKGARKQRFTIKWNARWKRKNYDLHNVLGFYMSWLAVFIVITGLVWGFEWFSKGYYRILSGGKAMPEYSQPLSDTTQFIRQSGVLPVDYVWKKLAYENPLYAEMEVHFPVSKEESIAVNINPEAGTSWKTDYRYFDQHTLKELQGDQLWGKLNSATTADKIIRMNYDIHVGAILGLPGKVLAFFLSLIASSLPVTGFMIWLGRRKKERNTAKKERKQGSKKTNRGVMISENTF